MVARTNVSYAVASGASCFAGRYPGGRLSGAVALGDAAPGGGLASAATLLSGNVGLADAAPGGGLSGPYTPSWVSAMPLNTWAVVPHSNLMSDLDIYSNTAVVPSGADWVGRGSAGWFAWTGWAWDESSGTAYYPMLGGHSDYGGNDPFKASVRAEQTTHSRIRLPSGALPGASLTARDGNEADGTGKYSDGRLRAHHSYHNHRWVPGVGLVICRLTAAFYNPGSSDTRRIWTVDATTGEATERCDYRALTQMGNGEGSVDYDPVRDCLWTIGSATSTLVQVTGLSGSTWTATKRGVWDNWLAPSGAQRYVPGADVLAMFPTYAGAGLGIRNLSTYAVSNPTLSGSFSTGLVLPTGTGNQPMNGFEWSTDLGCFVMWGNTSATTEISTLTPSNSADLTQPWVRGTLTVSGSNTVTPPAVPSDGVGRFAISPSMGVILIHVSPTQPIYAYRYK